MKSLYYALSCCDTHSKSASGEEEELAEMALKQHVFDQNQKRVKELYGPRDEPAVPFGSAGVLKDRIDGLAPVDLSGVTTPEEVLAAQIARQEELIRMAQNANLGSLMGGVGGFAAGGYGGMRLADRLTGRDPEERLTAGQFGGRLLGLAGGGLGGAALGSTIGANIGARV